MFEHVSGWTVTWKESSHKVSRELHDWLRDRRDTSKCRPLVVAKQLFYKSTHAYVCVVPEHAEEADTCVYRKSQW